MYFTPLHPAIAHLNEYELVELMTGYFARVKSTVLLQQYKIDATPNQLRKILPPKLLDQTCAVCGAAMIQDVPSRNSIKIGWGKARCSMCDHEDSDACRCKPCVTERKQQASEMRARMQAIIVSATVAEQSKCRNFSQPFADIPLVNVVAFLALIRCCTVDSDGLCGPLSKSQIPYAPTTALMSEFISLLQQSGLIAVSEYSADGTIGLNGKEIVFDMQNVRWLVPDRETNKLIDKIEIAGLTGFWPEHWHGEVESLWMKLALSECRQFYDYCAEERGFRAQGDVAVNDMLANLLRDFSVGQAYRAIWMGARDASDFIIRTKTNRAHAANYMIGACQRWADRARAEGWLIEVFKRNYKLPRSMISYVLFDVILKIGERGFNNVVSQNG
jgi:hypothetical protein